MSGPLQIQCDRHPAPIGVPCAGDGACCARRIARALMIGSGVGDPAEADKAIADAIARGKARGSC